MRRQSIQQHLIATVMLSQFFLAAGLVFAGLFYTQRRLISALDDAMGGRAMSVAALVRYTEAATGDVYFEHEMVVPSLDPTHPDLFAVWTERSGLLVRSTNWPTGLDISPNVGRVHWSFRWAGAPYRGLRVLRVPVLDREQSKTFHPRTLTIVYATPLVSLQAEARKASALILLASTLMLGVTILFSLWEVRRGLLPLQKLAAEATAVSAQNWNFRVPDEVQQIEELQPLSESITHMLKRLHDSFTQQKEFVANAAHEFKTPVAVLKSTLQTVLQRPRLAEEYKTGLQCALEDLDRLEMLLQGMLRLALAEQWEQRESVRDLHTVELGASCEEAIERFRALAETRDLKISFSRNGFAPVRADPDDLRIVWTNLLENAVRYSREGGPVEVSIARKNNRIVQVVFADHGQGIAEADLPHIFERFYRGDPSRTRSTGGFGLGLAIARTLIAAYGGTIWADSEPGQGTRITVELPFEDIRPSSYS